MSRTFSPRLFADFGYDSCLIIQDLDEFTRRLGDATQRALPAFHMRADDVVYYDPLQTAPAQLRDVFFLKHFRFAYQREYRFAWIPTAPQPPLRTFDIEIGDLHDLATLVPAE